MQKLKVAIAGKERWDGLESYIVLVDENREGAGNLFNTEGRVASLEHDLNITKTDHKKDYARLKGENSKVTKSAYRWQLATIGIGAAFIWAFGAAFILFKLISITVGLRISEEEELIGVDIAEHKAHAYNDFQVTR